MSAVLFDFSGTLFRIESTDSWLRAVVEDAGLALPEAELAEYARALEDVGALPGGKGEVRVPEELAEVWRVRDESAEAHRAAYTGLSRLVPLPDPALHDALYERHKQPAAWSPYPDAAEVLGALKTRDVRIAVVSNIGWDLRPVFRAHGLDRLVDAYILSFEHGVQKPESKLFAIACGALGVEPRSAVMVGDDRRADGGAAALGCRVHFVDHLPVAERPDGLRPLLQFVG
ncbi:HAD family hydrolase [Streptomyces acidiscabies]|uniref:HAD family hydrolase n=1 Tax=Streptomyces acidiscabies TaxID=42234 RepID=A0AAP6BJ22_9ACTN|nr:HAD family hydrolase [Streptomyces acidiscabies]MBP5935204.1 HAD hydrolase-like protein [Streptomyces sp. LBUM 1476]MBZ3916967.1 HAD hydrolase-like protein [Streptomyces acidiscabies]MDX2965500.1 HAD family hydrolase [Streptomyces acidiscabies]MDX3024275.1 HAD family hydrolase [Streptomyces acidiscabies]MDX3793082.1 HAD family hydrolase [Streptomyces acidiscabies]